MEREIYSADFDGDLGGDYVGDLGSNCAYTTYTVIMKLRGCDLFSRVIMYRVTG